MAAVIEVSRAEHESLAAALTEANIPYRLTKRSNFDGFFPLATFVIETVGTLGGLLVPILLYYLEHKAKKGHVTINGVVVSGLSIDQVDRINEALSDRD